MSLLTTRRHAILAIRGEQMRLNALAAVGGRPYVAARLWRAPNETDVSWAGDPQRGICGRLARTANVNDAGRVAAKINQYLFRSEAVRQGGDPGFLANCTGCGESVHAFMQRVSLSVTHGRWCWIQVDRPAIREGGESLSSRPRPRFILWDALDVPDWCIGPDGELRWILVQSRVYDNANPFAEPVVADLFTLYERTAEGVLVTEEVAGSDAAVGGLRRRVRIPGLDRIPFILVGTPSERAWWFDDVENVQAQMLNLDSMHAETLMETVYPQLVVPTSLANSLEVSLAERSVDGRRVAALVRELTLGRKIPICESGEDKGISRYITPGGNLGMMTEEADRKRRLLFDMAGLALFNRETRQSQTAESKAFDQLDTNATLRNRAILLQEAETRAVALLRVFDPSIATWEPRYQQDFDVVDVAALSQALATVANAPDRTPLVRKIAAKVTVRLLRELASGIVTDDEFNEALAEIDETDFSTLGGLLPDPFADAADGDGDGSAAG